MTPTPRLTLVTIVSVLVFLGLAILGSGGFAAFFPRSALTAVVVVTVLQTVVALFSGGDLSQGMRWSPPEYIA